MKLPFVDKLKGILIVPIGLAAILVPYSLLLGWNLITLVLFWFVLVPWLAISLPTWFSVNKNIMLKSIVGLIIFYGLMVFMIYQHYQTGYFLVMMISGVVNLAIVSFVIKTIEPTPAALD